MFERIGEYHTVVTRYFCQSFDGSIVSIEGPEFAVTKEYISHAIGVIPKGERWYKTQFINEDYSQFLLRPTHKDLD